MARFKSDIPNSWFNPAVAFDRDGSIRLDVLDDNLDSYYENGQGVIIPVASINGQILSEREQQELLKHFLVDFSRTKFDMMIGVLKESPDDTVMQINRWCNLLKYATGEDDMDRAMSRINVRGFAVYSPRLVADVDVQRATFEGALDLGLPTAICHMPALTKSVIDEDLISELLSKYDNIIFILDKYGNSVEVTNVEDEYLERHDIAEPAADIEYGVDETFEVEEKYVARHAAADPVIEDEPETIDAVELEVEEIAEPVIEIEPEIEEVTGTIVETELQNTEFTLADESKNKYFILVGEPQSTEFVLVEDDFEQVETNDQALVPLQARDVVALGGVQHEVISEEDIKPGFGSKLKAMPRVKLMRRVIAAELVAMVIASSVLYDTVQVNASVERSEEVASVAAAEFVESTMPVVSDGQKKADKNTAEAIVQARVDSLTEAAANLEYIEEERSTDIENSEIYQLVQGSYEWTGPVISKSAGTVTGPNGRETYYNLNMNGVVRIMRNRGNTDTYWVRSDGCKMLGNYIMVAANLNVHPRGSIVRSSRGLAMVCDTGGFASSNPQQLDIATSW